MSKFIGLNIATLDEHGKMYRTGSLLINIDHIISVEAQGKPCDDSVCKVRALHNHRSFLVEGNMIDVLDVMKRAGADFHAFDNKKQVSKAAEQRVKGAK